MLAQATPSTVRPSGSATVMGRASAAARRASRASLSVFSRSYSARRSAMNAGEGLS